jgi:hypothetical protein
MYRIESFPGIAFCEDNDKIGDYEGLTREKLTAHCSIVLVRLQKSAEKDKRGRGVVLTDLLLHYI